MQLTFLGQAGFLLKSGDATLLIDPYLSDSVKKQNPAAYRRQPVDENFFAVHPTVLLCTHAHADHMDPDTLSRYLPAGGITVLAPESVWKVLRCQDGNRYVQLDRHARFTVPPFRVTAVRAVHSDPAAVGFLVECEGKTLYFTGDTLYSEEIFDDIQQKVDILILPVNGEGNNMNLYDAVDFAARIQADTVIPTHFGMLDDIKTADIKQAVPQWLTPHIYEAYTF